MKRKIVGFYRDALGDWVAELACGHTQHVRHDPPWQNRPWVHGRAERKRYLGQLLTCAHCHVQRTVRFPR